MKWHKTIRTARSVPCSEGMSSRTSCRTHRSRSARLTTRGPRASRLSRSMSRTSSCATFQLVALPRQPDILQLRAEDSKKIVLVLPREGCYFHHRPSLPWDASAVTAMGQVTNQHKRRLAADESYLAASLKVQPPKKKIVRSEDASQRLIREGHWQQGGQRDAEAETKACSPVRFRLFLAPF